MKRVVFFFLVICLVLVACDPSDSETIDVEDPSAGEEGKGTVEKDSEDMAENSLPPPWKQKRAFFRLNSRPAIVPLIYQAAAM